jgi:myo-inositol-1(or 4)-monophosphatase
LCYIAAGRCDGFWEVHLNAWDVAAGGLIAEEAGAIVTDLEGGHDYLSHSLSMIASAPGLHPHLIAALRE